MADPWSSRWKFLVRYSRPVGLCTVAVAVAASGAAAFWGPGAPSSRRLAAACAPCVDPPGGPGTPFSAVAIPELEIVSVKIHATPQASIAIDGIEIGVTPLDEIRLEVGAHTFRAVMPDGRVLEKSWNIDQNATTLVFR